MKKIIIKSFLIIATLILLVLIINIDVIKDKKEQGLTYEEKVERYRHARNIIVADTAFSKKERDEMLKKIEENYFPNGDLPEETEADRIEQEKYKKLITSFKLETDKIVNDKSLSKEEKKRKIGEILKKFLNDSRN